MKKASLFGIVGIVLLLMVVLIVFGISMWGKLSSTLSSTEDISLHVNATMDPSEHYNTSDECDITLMNILRFKVNSSNSNLTYGRTISLINHKNESKEVCNETYSLIKNNFPSIWDRGCVRITAKEQKGVEPILDCAPKGDKCKSGEIVKMFSCSSYIPDDSPEKGWIKVKMVLAR